MNWSSLHPGIGTIVALIIAIASLIYWKRKPIKKWFAGRKVGVTLKAGPVEVSLDEEDKPKEAGRAGRYIATGDDIAITIGDYATSVAVGKNKVQVVKAEGCTPKVVPI